MTQVPRTQAEAFNALLRMHFGSFLHKAVEDLNPGSPFQSNWHICAIEHALEQMSHTSKGKAKRYRYYVTRPDQTTEQPAYRVPAHDLEQIVTNKLAAYFASPHSIAQLTGQNVEAHALQQALAKADLAAATLRSGTARAKHQIVAAVLAKATLFEERVELALSHDGLADVIGIELDAGTASITLHVPACRFRKGHQIRLVIEGEGQPSKLILPTEPTRDEKLVTLLAEAYRTRQLVLDNPETPLADLAKQRGQCRKHLAQLVEIACLAPDIVEVILAGKQQSSLTAAELRVSNLPLVWGQQLTLLMGAALTATHA